MGKSQQRSDWAMGIAIVLGLVIGIAIKRVRIGIILGLLLGGLIVWTGWIRHKRRSQE
ncbi:MAG: hypothetical protein RL316_1289 [Bacteroidota bacterium]|jgi:divalent metal cation (Fe/Co/Zn/Cd) transporter